MNKPVLYALSISANHASSLLVQPSETRSFPGVINISTQVRAYILASDSDEGAIQRGLEKAREWWPESEGWSGHSVALCVTDITLQDATL